MGAAPPLTTADFQTSVGDSEKPVLVDFWAEWCGPCKAIGPVVDQVAEEYAGRVSVYKVDVDAEQQLAIDYGVLSIPTLLVFKGGKEFERIVGLTSKDGISLALDRALI